MLTVGGFVVPFAGQKWCEITTPDGWNVPQPTTATTLDGRLADAPGTNHRDGASPQYTRAGEIRRDCCIASS